MKEFEVPSSSLFNGEELLPDRFRGDLFASRQWLFEKHYLNSEFALGIPFRDRFFRGNGLEQYQFFRGEPVCPEWLMNADTWWDMERSHWYMYNGNEKVPFVLFLREWVFDKAAPNSNFGMWGSPTNPWLDAYLEYAPMHSL